MRIDHVAMNVRDLEGTRDFFVKYFGGRANDGYHNPRTGLRTYMLEFDGGARLELMHWEDMPEGQRPKHALGYCHLSMSVGSKEAVDALTRQLVGDGYQCVSGPRTTGDGYYESVILLPQGEELEITV